MKAAIVITLFLLSCSLLPCLGPIRPDNGGCFSLVRSAFGEENWKREFEEICGNTDDSMNLKREELQALIARCDKLKPLIEALEETPRKVYLKKLQMCRNLLAFVFDVKGKK